MTLVTKQTSPDESHSRQWRSGVGAMALVMLGIISTVWWTAGGVEVFAQRTVGDLLAASPELDPIEATSQLCGDPVCVEGWRTNFGSYLRFESRGEAEYWATLLGPEGVQLDTVVLDMRGHDLTFEQRRKAIDVLFSTEDWS